MTDSQLEAAAVAGDRDREVGPLLATLDDGRQIHGFVDDGSGA